ncbi:MULTISPECIES: pyoverdine biosynthesis transaminase PtaA [Pseudomonas]|jgi:histidinol-phosphate aminotransferase|uniref:Aminotransferase n=1 Tax=Pseudomonas fluorescens TaxID=294 RepID=A0A423N8J6_PSEFL|nr:MULTISPECIES: pyridoxal phosphate-dependent aminotransferase [Pseudomonas]EJM06694.1 PLP-dependent enzyme, histidinol-phosphate/aromatic aminotransferase or cobyric acid decarboxylase [Pseudomonas sp. GM16]EJM45836.1 PLP-dependent enzyme, histidinol-phosphate/aromatic aminotransferase or cobyric acid decarboxylase [Pseudomonas sp. GM24]RON94523.1 aminotransferase [Pseudomonas fluorescens]
MVDVTRRSFVGFAATLPLLAHNPWAQAQIETASVAATSDEVLINFNESPWGPSTAARQAMQEGIALSGRYPYKIQYRLNALFARQQGIPEDFVQTYSGSKQALQHAVHAFTQQGSLVVAAPSYEDPVQAARGRNVAVHEVPLNAEHAHDLPRMLAADHQPGLIYICNPNNPTGTLTARSDIERALKDKPKGSILLVDEAYIDFSQAITCIPLVKDHPDLLVLRTFSKIYGMAGARLGIAVGNPALLEQLEVFGNYNVPAASSLLGAIASLEDASLLAQRKQNNTRLREETIAWLSARGFRCTASQANCFMIDVRRPAAAVVKALAERHVHVGRVWKEWPTWVRVSVGTDDDMRRFREAFAKVLA